MSSGKLKASTNRVRTSIALQANSMWTKTIGLEAETGVNSAVEATLNAPAMGGGRAARRAAAAELVQAAGGFDAAQTNYQDLLSMARVQGAVGGQNRGACKICGQIGHLTKQCRNHLSVHFNPDAAKAGGGSMAKPAQALPTLAEATAGSDSSSLSSLDSDSDDSSSSEDERKRRKDKEKARKRKHKEKGKDKKYKHSKSKKQKRESERREKRHKS